MLNKRWTSILMALLVFFGLCVGCGTSGDIGISETADEAGASGIPLQGSEREGGVVAGAATAEPSAALTAPSPAGDAGMEPDVSLHVAGESAYPVGTERIEVILRNNTPAEGSADMYYTVQQYDGAQWRTLQFNFDVTDIALVLEPWQEHSFTIHLHPDQHLYEPGEYRVCKRAHIGDAVWELAAAFTLE